MLLITTFEATTIENIVDELIDIGLDTDTDTAVTVLDDVVESEIGFCHQLIQFTDLIKWVALYKDSTMEEEMLKKLKEIYSELEDKNLMIMVG